MKSIIIIASTLALFTAGTGQLPKVVHQLRIAQLLLLKEMQTKNWGLPWTPAENIKAKK